MLSQTPEITTPAGRPRPGIGAPTHARHSRTNPAPNAAGGRHRRAGTDPADQTQRSPLSPAPSQRPSRAQAPAGNAAGHRPTTLADSPPSYRAAARTDDTPWLRPPASAADEPWLRSSMSADDTPRYRAARSADAPSRTRAARTAAGSADAGPRARRRHAAAGRRRAPEETPWDKAAAAVQAVHRATSELARRQRPPGAPGSHTRSIVVSAVPSFRDALSEQVPTARRMAGAVRDWALASQPARPVTGSRRAPGTLPIESWLLIGRQRQQALLAALVAVGVMLVVIPSNRYADDATNTSAAGGSLTTVDHQGRAEANKPVAVPEATTKAPQRTTPDQPAQPGGRHRAAPETSAAATPPEAQASASSTPTGPGSAPSAGADPKAYGPANSLRHTGSDTVALTFDDGPDPVQTPKLLKLLADHQVKATFCVVGERARAHPELVRQIVAEGHTLCNHSWDHSLTLGVQDPADIRHDLEATDQAIRAAVPDAAIPYFRAPGGIFTHRLVSVAGEYDMKSLYWAVDPRDWDHTFDLTDAQHVERVVAEVKDNVRPGSIVLSHDFNQPQTIAAYEQLLPYLTEKYELGLP